MSKRRKTCFSAELAPPLLSKRRKLVFQQSLRHLPRGSRTNKQCRKIWNGTRGVLRPKAKNFLNSMNIKTHRGNKFETRNIEYILNNPVYCGFVRWTPCGKINRDFANKNSLISKGTFESIIDKELFEKAKEKYRVKKYN